MLKKEKLQGIEAKFAAAKAENQQNAKAALEEVFSSAFEQAPELLRVRWRQYTPYFNDGDACIFRVGEFSYLVQGLKESHADYDDEAPEGAGWIGCGHYLDKHGAGIPAGTKDVIAQLDKVWNADDVLLEAFGDHAMVTAIPNASSVKFERDDYEHD